MKNVTLVAIAVTTMYVIQGCQSNPSQSGVPYPVDFDSFPPKYKKSFNRCVVKINKRRVKQGRPQIVVQNRQQGAATQRKDGMVALGTLYGAGFLLQATPVYGLAAPLAGAAIAAGAANSLKYHSVHWRQEATEEIRGCMVGY